LKMLGFDLIEVNLKTVKSGSYFLWSENVGWLLNINLGM
jgi:hypothetical protein